MEKEKAIGHIIEHFSFATIQAACNMMILLEQSGINNSEFIEWKNQYGINIKLVEYEQQKNRYNKYIEVKLKSKRCGQCGGIMMVAPVNSMPGDQVGGDWRSVWICTNIAGCGNDEYSLNTPQQEMDLHGFSSHKKVIENQLDNQKRKRLAQSLIRQTTKKNLKGCR